MTINCKGTLIDLSRPKIMGIINTTPDSFYDGGSSETLDLILKKAEKFLSEGATFLDIGGYSTKPGAENVSEDLELQRTVPVVEAIVKRFPEALLSVDTFRSKVARKTIEAGAHLINDVSGGSLDNQMFSTIADLQVPYVLMHMQGTPQTMQNDPKYQDVTLEVNQFLLEKAKQLQQMKVSDIILDPGFGFAKTLDHNYELFNKLELIGFGEFPVLVGISRKSMLYKLLNTTPKEVLAGTSALNLLALQKGAKILRVHDVKEAQQMIKIHLALTSNL
ncbi:dihydropteroate synthase [Vaginella massiliensis]|uniref:dihydropteroate synthase n=1 Tax=Vaginella massiliensis TaxID=1816680 RepID=UPI000838D9BD|nr:dihydropteroate synthase [Vaginella massiliensis]